LAIFTVLIAECGILFFVCKDMLTLDLQPIEINAINSLSFSDLKPGPYLKLGGTDTGMVLATGHGIVKNHGGDIKVYANEAEIVLINQGKIHMGIGHIPSNSD
jgi:hypothetical protein